MTSRCEARFPNIQNCVRPDGAPAETEFRVQRIFQRAGREFTLLEALPRTGRKSEKRSKTV